MLKGGGSVAEPRHGRASRGNRRPEGERNFEGRIFYIIFAVELS